MSEPLRLWSVTSLLKLGMGTSDPLVNWAVGTTAEYALDNHDALAALDREAALDVLKRARYRKSGKAMARGTEIHKAAEAKALGTEIVVDVEHIPYVEQYQRFLDEHQPEFLMAEAPVYHPSNPGYAGTLDAIMVIDGQRLVVDLKTTDKTPDSGRMRPPYPEAALQLCAYRRAEEVGVLAEMRYLNNKRYYAYSEEQQHEPMPETDGAAVVVISPVDYLLIPVRTDDEVYRCFLAACACARFNVDVSKRVFGPPVTPRPKLELVKEAE